MCHRCEMRSFPSSRLVISTFHLICVIVCQLCFGNELKSSEMRKINLKHKNMKSLFVICTTVNRTKNLKAVYVNRSYRIQLKFNNK